VLIAQGQHVLRVGGACGPPPPVAASLVPRCALLPAATPRMMGLRPMCTTPVPNRFASRWFRTG